MVSGDSAAYGGGDGGGKLIAFDFVPLHEVMPEIVPEVARHYSEMSKGDDYGIPNLDLERYIAASLAGYCKTIIARDAGKLIAYAIFTISTNARYKHIIEATSDGIFIEAPYRGTVTQIFLKKIDEYMQQAGVLETNYILNDERVGRLLGKQGYKPGYIVWSKKYGK